MNINEKKHLRLYIENPDDIEKIAQCGYALASVDRVKVLKSLLHYPKSISTISSETDIPISTVSRYAQDLAQSGLISISYQPGIKGHTKFCAQEILSCRFVLEPDPQESDNQQQLEFTTEMPIGMFSQCSVCAPCGMLGATEAIAVKDIPSMFFLPERMNAECLWFNTGMLGYLFPLPPISSNICSLSFSFEVCSETHNYNLDWPSDITIRINGTEVTTFTSPGDFGGTRGKFTPAYWPVTCTQYGLLKKIEITKDGVFLDGKRVNKTVTLSSLEIEKNNVLLFEIGVKETAVHCGGINLFGKNFGNFNQAIIMNLKQSNF